jgi:hypothetical protein
MTMLASVANLAFAIAGALLIAYGIALALNVRGLAERRVEVHARPDPGPSPFPVGSRMGRPQPPKTVTVARLQGGLAIVIGLSFLGIYLW